MTTTIAVIDRNLRVHDNPVLERAATDSNRLVPLFIQSTDTNHTWTPGAASRWWLHHSLRALHQDLAARGSALIVRQGDWAETLLRVVDHTHARRVVLERSALPWHRHGVDVVRTELGARGIEVELCDGNYVCHPTLCVKSDGTPYRVYTPFAAALRKQLHIVPPRPAPAQLPPLPDGLHPDAISELHLLPNHPWSEKLAHSWRPGEEAALATLESFARENARTYDATRDLPATPGTSRLSPYLHFGEISVRQVMWRFQDQHDAGTETFIRELLWREFANYVLWHFPHTTDQPMNAAFERFPWRENAEPLLQAWQRGHTGFPIIDAGMRELWHTGWMHNRVRMIVASFLTKHLRIAWQTGARWFWDTLVDADLANNSMNWQWVAGCGVDAAPYFRIFNPVLQGEKFDPDGNYVRRWIPELSDVPDRWIHQPWKWPERDVLRGRYPSPVIDLDRERTAALAAYRNLNKPGK